MPTILISVYLNEDEYNKYIIKKKELNNKLRIILKNDIKKL